MTSIEAVQSTVGGALRTVDPTVVPGLGRVNGVADGHGALLVGVAGLDAAGPGAENIGTGKFGGALLDEMLAVAVDPDGAESAVGDAPDGELGVGLFLCAFDPGVENTKPDG